jgi:asparagine synthase (glutamine-hydrolysing)
VGPAPVQPALGSLSHRGPDDEGTFFDDRCALGHRRLSIIDLSARGHQPMTSSGTLWIAYNGEIYNFIELRQQLSQQGHRFASQTDTEVLLAGFEEWGLDLFPRLRGMFAFAIWDTKLQRLTLVRDRLGKKPLYVTVIEGRLWFASELQCLAEVPGFSRTPDLRAIDSYLTYGYVPAPATGLSDVYKLPPATWVQADAVRPFSFMPTSWWQPVHEPKLDITYEDAEVELRRLMEQAVRRRLISDVPLGAFLSGGIDSSIVVGLMAGLTSGGPVRTFSIGFADRDYDELPHARRVAQMWGTDHTEHVVEPDAANVIPSLVQHYGEPYADSSALPTYYVAQQTRRHVTVALSGDGGDESFAGYERYFGMRLAAALHRIPLSGPIARTTANNLPSDRDFRDPVAKAKRFLSAAGLTPAQRYALWSAYFSPAQKGSLYGPVLKEVAAAGNAEEWMEHLFESAQAATAAERAMSADVRSYLPFDLNVKVDIASMMHSLEVRAPFLDVDVMEFAARLPLSYKLRGRTGKWILRSAFRDLLPLENVRRPKMGFGVPVGRWFQGPLLPLLEDALLSEHSRARGYFDPAVVQTLLDQHRSSTQDHTPRLWSLLMLELWHRHFIDG